MHANSDTDDSLGFNGKANYSMRLKKEIPGLDICDAVQFDLKSVRVYNSLLF